PCEGPRIALAPGRRRSAPTPIRARTPIPSYPNFTPILAGIYVPFVWSTGRASAWRTEAGYLLPIGYPTKSFSVCRGDGGDGCRRPPLRLGAFLGFRLAGCGRGILVDCDDRADYRAGYRHHPGARAMAATIVRRTDWGFVVGV